MYDGEQPFNLGIVIAMIAYLGLCAVYGIYLKSRMKKGGDFWAGGRSVGPLATAMSFCASYFSTVAVIGSPAMYAMYGAGYLAIEQLGSVWITVFLMFIVLGLKMRVVSERVGAVSLPGFFASRYESNALRIISAIIIACMMIPYGVSCFKGIGTALEVVAGIKYEYAVFIIAVVAMIYLVASGYFGAAQIDILHGFFIMLGVLGLVYIAVKYWGGVGAAISAGAAVDERLGQVPGPIGSWPLVLSYSLIWVVSGFGQPQLITKFIGLKDRKTISTVSIISILWCTLYAVAMLPVAMGGRAIVEGVIEDYDLMTPMMVALYSNFAIRCIFLCACVAAGLSTVVALVLSAASALCKDLVEDGYYANQGKILDEKKRVMLSRAFIVLVIVVMLIMSIRPWDMVWQLATMASGTMGAAFAPALTIGLYYKGGTKAGAVASVVGGAAATIAGYLIGLGSGVVHPIMPGVITATILFFAVSACTKKLDSNTIAMCFDKNWRPAK